VFITIFISFSQPINPRIDAKGFRSLLECSRVSVEGFFADYPSKTRFEVSEAKPNSEGLPHP
jgi:hypothetical protein